MKNKQTTTRSQTFRSWPLGVIVGVILLGSIGSVLHGSIARWNLLLNPGLTTIGMIMLLRVHRRQRREARAMDRKLDQLLEDTARLAPSRVPGVTLKAPSDSETRKLH